MLYRLSVRSLLSADSTRWPGIYDRHRDRVEVDGDGNSLDNLEYADLTLARLREAMEDAGLWDQTTVIVTSDHPNRPAIWEGFGLWTEEERSLSRLRQKARVPCLIKPARRSTGLVFDKEFNTVALSSLSLKLARGEIQTFEEIAAFLSVPREGLGIK